MKLRFIRIIDFYFGDWLCYFLSLFRKQHVLPDNPISILIIRNWSLGESLLALPVIKQIRTRFPSAKISVLVTGSSKPIFMHQTFIDEIITFNLPTLIKLLPRRFDIGFDFMPYFRHSAVLCAWTCRYVVGFDTFRTRSRLYDHKVPYDDTIHMVHMFDRFNIWDSTCRSSSLIPMHSREIADPDIRSASEVKSTKVGIHLGTEITAPWRAWSYDNFRTVIRGLLVKYPDINIFLTGAGAEKELNRRMMQDIADPRVIDLVGRIDLFELARLMKTMQVYLTSDTGPMHIAASMGCTTIGIFGPNTPMRFGPFPPEKHIALYDPPVGYAPTINVHRGEFGDQNKDMRLNVVNRIKPDRVLMEVDRILMMQKVV